MKQTEREDLTLSELFARLVELGVPDSALCALSTEHARECSDPFLFNHAVRSYLFARAIARQRGAAVDNELLYIACALHDLGLTKTAPALTRFEVEGADAAVKLVGAHGLDPAKCDTVWDAIALHTTPVIPQRKCAEVALCQLGTAVDVGFAPTALVPESALIEAVAAFPRLSFKTQMPHVLCGMLRRGNAEAALSLPVAEAAARLLPQAQLPPNICDVILAAGFDE